MNNIYENAVEVARRTMTLFFVVDTSGSMGGSKIGTLNSAIEEVIPEIRKISGENADAAIKIAVLDFSSGAHWITPAPIDAESFCWNYLDADGLTDFGEMCKMLNEKLSRNAFMRDVAGSFAPAIFLLSDGEPTDEYKKELGRLKENNWFKKAIKVAVAIGEDANRDVLAEFTGSKEAVVAVHTPEALVKMIRFVSVTASQIGSQSSGRSANRARFSTRSNPPLKMIQRVRWKWKTPPSRPRIRKAGHGKGRCIKAFISQASVLPILKRGRCAKIFPRASKRKNTSSRSFPTGTAERIISDRTGAAGLRRKRSAHV